MGPDIVSFGSPKLPHEPIGTALSVRGMSMRFGGTQALDGVDLSVAGTEIHVLLGENGSGKSTLIKVLAGFHTPVDCSGLSVYGSELSIPTSPSIMRLHGVGFVHQELGLIPALSVTENMFLTSIAETTLGTCRWREMADRAKEVLRRLQIAVSPTSPVESLGQGDRALVAIARALMELEIGTDLRGSERRGLLVMDEPTAFLDASETERLWGVLSRLRGAGHSVLMVLHDLTEALVIADRLTVLRDGCVVGTLTVTEASVGVLTRLILGNVVLSGVPQRSSDSTAKSRSASAIGTYCSAHGMVHIEAFLGAASGSLEMRGGDVVGLTGLRGGAWEHLPYRLFGDGEPLGGTIVLDDKEFPLSSLCPRKAMDLGMALIPSDRLGAACYEHLSLAENLISVRLPAVMRGRFLSARRTKTVASQQVDAFDIRPRELDLDLALFSGGNQQKAVIARWLQRAPRVLLLHEPTQGVDVGARVQVHAAIRQAASLGAAVLLASSDHGELADACDRVLVMRRDGTLLEIAGGSLTQEAISQACLSGTLPSPPADNCVGGPTSEH